MSFILYASFCHLRGLQISFYFLSSCLMSVSIDQWRVSIGLFYGEVYGHIRIKLSIGSCDLKVIIIMLCFYAAFAFLLLLKHGHVEVNPGSKKKEVRFFSCFHWNLNSMLAHNKLSLL